MVTGAGGATEAPAFVVVTDGEAIDVAQVVAGETAVVAVVGSFARIFSTLELAAFKALDGL